MERLLISKEWDRDFARYTFKPKGYVDNFFERTAGMIGIGFDKRRGRWTAPAREETLAYLRATFGPDCLVWSGGGAADNTPQSPFRPIQPRRPSPQPKPTSPPKELPEHWRNALHRTEEQLKVRRYSWRTVKSYLSHLRSFFANHMSLHLEGITSELIRTYIVMRTEKGNYAEATQNQMLNAIKFWLEQVEGREKAFFQLRPKEPKKLPGVLSMEEVSRLFQATGNLRDVVKITYCFWSSYFAPFSTKNYFRS